VLRHDKLKEDFCKIDIYDSDSDSDDWDYCPQAVDTLSVEDCLQAAYDRNMHEAVCAMSTLGKSVHRAIWLCWRKSLKNQKNEAEEVSSGDITRIKDIAHAYEANLVFDLNPMLLPLLVARFRYNQQANLECMLGKFHPIVVVSDDIFKHIATFCFTFDPEPLAKKVESNLYFQNNAEWCSDCDGYFLPWDCYCLRRGGDGCSLSS